jgi:hypothetical protein
MSVCRLSALRPLPSSTFMRTLANISNDNHKMIIAIHQKIPTIFQSKNPRAIELKLDEMIKKEGENLDITHFASLIHQAAKVKFTMDLSSITKLILQRTEDKMSMIYVGQMFYGLQQYWSDQEQHVLQLIEVVTPKVKSLTRITPQTIANIFFGLQNLSSSHEEVRALLRVLTEKIQSSKNQLWKAQEIGMALRGLRNMSSADEEVLSLISALIPNINICRDEMQPLSMVNVMSGLRNMSSKKHEVASLIAALVPTFKSCKKPLGSVQICLLLNGKLLIIIIDDYSSHLPSSLKCHRQSPIGRYAECRHQQRSCYAAKRFHTANSIVSRKYECGFDRPRLVRVEGLEWRLP